MCKSFGHIVHILRHCQFLLKAPAYFRVLSQNILQVLHAIGRCFFSLVQNGLHMICQSWYGPIDIWSRDHLAVLISQCGSGAVRQAAAMCWFPHGMCTWFGLALINMSSFWQYFHHWLHWKLSCWQLPVQPMMKISSKWRHFRFSALHNEPVWFTKISKELCTRFLFCFVLGWCLLIMVTSSNRNIFRIAGPLWGESTGHRWIPLTKASGAELWCFWSAREKNGSVNNQDAGDYDVTVFFTHNLQVCFI